MYGAWYYARQGQCGRSSASRRTATDPSSAGDSPTNVALLLGFVAVCAAEVVVGVLLWGGSTIAPWLAFAPLPVELLFWIGFALPFGPLLGLARTVLVVAILLV